MNKSIKVALVGARGHVGFELIQLIDQHPVAQLSVAYSRQHEGQLIVDHVPGFSDADIRYCGDYVEDIEQRDVDVVFLALPNGVAKSQASLWQTLAKQACIIDLSADFRFDDDWQYGQPETRQSALLGQCLIANPGCYATAMQLGILPLLNHINGVVHTFGVSGYSGAGTSPNDKNDPIKLKDNLMAYQLVDHIHEREVSHVLGTQVRLIPQVASYFRGIHLVVTVPLCSQLSVETIKQKFVHHYENHELIKVMDEVPQVSAVRDTHEVHIGGFAIKEQQSQPDQQKGHQQSQQKELVLCVVIDNLLKGAATQAIQNMNLALSDQYPLTINSGIVEDKSGASS